MKLKIVSAYSKTELEESFNKFITDDIVVNYTETHIEEGPKTSYSIFIFYEMLSDVYPEDSTIVVDKDEKETSKEANEFMKELSSKEDIDRSLENNYSFFKTVNSFLK